VSEDGLTDHARINRAAWDAIADEFVPDGERRWASGEPAWGVWEIPERRLRVLPDVAGLDVVELGCGTAYWSAWLARRGARVTGVDNSPRQLATARRLQRAHGMDFPLVHASAEAVPLPDGGFDLAFSEYGASPWCDPARWLPEAARLLKPGGLLVFLTHSPIVMLCIPDLDGPTGDRLIRPYFGMREFDWPDHPSIEFNLTYAGWIAELGRNGFAVEALHEPQAPEDGDPGRHDYVTADWAHRWPQEAIWVARRRGGPRGRAPSSEARVAPAVPDGDLTEPARRNRAAWDAMADEWVPTGERKWARDQPSWGVWDVPEREVGSLPDVAGLDAIELGCGTAYWSAWLARRGARPTGIDNSAGQLETARRLQREHGLDFPLVHASAEAVPLPDAGFDLALSEYGACHWCDPGLWVPEAARLLRPGGLLVFLTTTPLFQLCVPDELGVLTGDRLIRPYFGMRRFEWIGDPPVEFNLTYGGWIAELGRSGFAVEALHELRAPEDGDPGRHDFITAEWAHRWPHEAIWVARRRG
jgi:SAM-dependent methyltransferase